MLRTWMFIPKDRITFTKILSELESFDLNTMSKPKSKSLNDAMKAKHAKSVETPSSSASAGSVALDGDGYVSEAPLSAGKANKQIEIEDGYVADVIEAPVPAAKKNPLYTEGIDASKVKKNVLYNDPPPSAARTVQPAPVPQPQPAPVVDTSNGYVMDTPGGNRPQLRAAGGPTDNGYIDTNTILPAYYAATSKPQLRAGGGGPQTAAPPANAIDVLQTLSGAGLHQYVPLFLQYGITALDVTAASQITDYYLQQLGIYDPNHRYMIIAAIASALQGLLCVCLHCIVAHSLQPSCMPNSNSRPARSSPWQPCPKPSLEVIFQTLALPPSMRALPPQPLYLPRPLLLFKLQHQLQLQPRAPVHHPLSTKRMMRRPRRRRLPSACRRSSSPRPSHVCLLRCSTCILTQHTAKIQLPTFDKPEADQKAINQLNEMYGTAADAKKKK